MLILLINVKMRMVFLIAKPMYSLLKENGKASIGVAVPEGRKTGKISSQ